MTSSPGPTPTASRARCSAVVQFDTAQACGRAGEAANSCSKAATSGPCVIQPERMTSAAASASCLADHGPGDRDHAGGCRRAARPARPPPGDELVDALLEVDFASKPSSSRRLRSSARRRGTGFTGALRAVLGTSSAGHMCSSERRARSSRRGLRPAADVETLSSLASIARQDVRARDVVDIDEVHGLQAVAEDDRRLAARDALHPADQHLGVAAVDVHARPVDVEVAQRDVVQPVHVVEGAQSPSLKTLAAP